jgi:cell shape-determining protein MreD
MRNLIAVPVIILAVMLQSAIVSYVTILRGVADLPLVMLAAWALQDEVETAWHWAVAMGVLVGFISGLSVFTPVLSYFFVVILAQALQRRVWQAPLLAMFSVTFLGTLGLNIFSMLELRLLNTTLPIADVFGLLVLPGVLMNMLLAIPVFAMMRDLARWVYPAPEVE